MNRGWSRGCKPLREANMIEGLETLLEGKDQPGLTEVRELLQELLAGQDGTGRLLDQQSLKRRTQGVYRLRFAIGGQTRSVVIKRLEPEIARRNELVARRWLPAVGLDGSGPPLLGSVAARSGVCVWHVYDDLGSCELGPREIDREPDRERLGAAVEVIAQMHTRFAGHALLGEVRLRGGDLGIHFYERNVRDAASALRAWQPPTAQRALRDRLLVRLDTLLGELPQRAEALAELGGPETLLHGDLWAINVFVIPTASGPCTRLIDWDHVAVGPATYDLSTFLLRFSAPHRPGVLERYREAVARGGWRLPGTQELNLLFETHEYARFANRIIWPAIALVMDHAEWGVEELAEIERWFDKVQPVLAGENEVATAPAP